MVAAVTIPVSATENAEPRSETRLRAVEEVPDQGYPQAEDDLRWYFADAAAAIGFHGQSAEGGGGGGIFDDMAAHMLHVAKHTPRQHKMAKRLREIDPLVQAMPADLRDVARVGLTPHAWSSGMRVVFTVRRGVCVAGLAMQTASAHALRTAKNRERESVRDFLEYESNACTKAKRVPERLRKIRDEATWWLMQALACYDALSRERLPAMRAERAAYVNGRTF